MANVQLKYSGSGPFYGYAGKNREAVDVEEGGTVEVSEDAAEHLMTDFPTFFDLVATKPNDPTVKK